MHLFGNYVISGVRRLRRDWAYTSMNVFCLAVGMTVCLLVFTYVRTELSTDSFHPASERLVRVSSHVTIGDQSLLSALSPTPLAETIEKRLSGVEETVRLYNASRNGPLLVRNAETVTTESNVFWADASFFDVFGFELLDGSPQTALAEPKSVVLSSRLATTLFGTESPIDEVIRVGLDNEEVSLTVRGVLSSKPTASHLEPALLGSRDLRGRGNATRWFSLSEYTYVRLRPAYSASRFKEDLTALLHDVGGDELTGFLTPVLQPIQEIHFQEDVQGALSAGSSLMRLQIFALVAAIILLISVTNYVNLSVARSLSRRREVGVRKSLGAHRRQVAGQFLSESVLISLVSFLVASALAPLLLPWFGSLCGASLSFEASRDLPVWTGLSGVALLLGLMSGSYPALFLSRFSASDILRGAKSKPGTSLWRGLVATQFAAAAGLLICTFFVQKQLDYLNEKPLGFDAESVVTVPLDLFARQKMSSTALLQEVQSLSSVQSASLASNLPTRPPHRWGVKRAEAGTDEKTTLMQRIGVDPEFIDVLDLKIVSGRFLRDASTETAEKEFVLNQTAVVQLGLDSPIGTSLVLNGDLGRVVGIIRDFHTTSLRSTIEPLILETISDDKDFLLVETSGDLDRAMNDLRKTWSQVAPLLPFSSSLLSSQIRSLYSEEYVLSRTTGGLAALALILACLGLVGLSTYSVRRRTREIGIRKALGATTGSILRTLARDFGTPVVIGAILSVPVGIVVVQTWLQNFAYRIPIEAGTVAASILLVLLVSTVGLCIQGIRIVRVDPARTLRADQ